MPDLPALSKLSDDDLRALNDYSGYLDFTPTLPFKWLINAPTKITALFTGNQFGKGECLTYETLIDTPNGRRSIGELYEKGEPFEVYSWDGEKLVKAKALPPFKKPGIRKIYRITMADGQWVEASSYHRILTTSGEFSTAELLHDAFHGHHREASCESYCRLADSLLIRGSNSESCPIGHNANAPRCGKTERGLPYHCFACSRQDGEQPLPEGDSEKSFVPSRGGVPQHIFCRERQTGDPVGRYANIRQLKCAPPSIRYAYHRIAARFFGFLGRVFCTTWTRCPRERRDGMRPLFAEALQPQSSPLNTPLTHPINGSLAMHPPLCFNGNHVVSIELVGSQEVFDTTVEKYHNYLAGGLIHHNTVIMDYYLRVWGKHPQKHKNIVPDDKIRTIRFASENLPGDSENEEVKNTQYPVLKRRFNPSWIAKDITARKSVVAVQPQTPRVLSSGQKVLSKPAQFEFVSYGQSTQAQAGVQRKSVWIDESAPKDFFDEQIPRLLAADGDLILSYTPVPGNIGWEFDELFERARIIYRTPAVRKRIKERFGEDLPEIQYTDSKDDIAVIMAATDDNPIYAKLAKEKSERIGREVTVDEYITDMLGLISDEDVIDARRYGLFRQLSGRLFKGFSTEQAPKGHVISHEKYFSDGVPHEWKHFRGIDWHESTPWACGWVAVSPDDEIFVYNEFNPAPDKMITMEIARVIAVRSQDYRFDLNLIDPLSAKIQPNTGLSSLEDINRIFAAFRKEGVGTGGYWQTWDTKSQKGRDEIRKRLQNATLCGTPFNNKVKKDGVTRTLPTLWICDNCHETIKSLKNWRREEWGDRSSLVTKDEKETPQQRWSHFCTMLEGLMKRPEVFAAKWNYRPIHHEPKRYFEGAG